MHIIRSKTISARAWQKLPSSVRETNYFTFAMWSDLDDFFKILENVSEMYQSRWSLDDTWLPIGASVSLGKRKQERRSSREFLKQLSIPYADRQAVRQNEQAAGFRRRSARINGWSVDARGESVLMHRHAWLEASGRFWRLARRTCLANPLSARCFRSAPSRDSR